MSAATTSRWLLAEHTILRRFGEFERRAEAPNNSVYLVRRGWRDESIARASAALAHP